MKNIFAILFLFYSVDMLAQAYCSIDFDCLSIKILNNIKSIDNDTLSNITLKIINNCDSIFIPQPEECRYFFNVDKNKLQIDVHFIETDSCYYMNHFETYSVSPYLLCQGDILEYSFLEKIDIHKIEIIKLNIDYLIPKQVKIAKINKKMISYYSRIKEEDVSKYHIVIKVVTPAISTPKIEKHVPYKGNY